MSLKMIHIFFIIVSIALLLFFGVWAFNQYRGNGGLQILVVSDLIAAALFIYLVRFIKKAKQL